MANASDRPTVLLVEDDQDTLEIFAAVLREQFRVYVSRNADHALAVAEEVGWDADILVVDLGLGDGKRGDHFVETYRERAQRRTPVIIVSGLPRAYELARSIQPRAVLSKPIQLDELLRVVNLHVRVRPPRPEPPRAG